MSGGIIIDENHRNVDSDPARLKRSPSLRERSASQQNILKQQRDAALALKAMATPKKAPVEPSSPNSVIQPFARKKFDTKKEDGVTKTLFAAPQNGFAGRRKAEQSASEIQIESRKTNEQLIHALARAFALKPTAAELKKIIEENADKFDNRHDSPLFKNGILNQPVVASIVKNRLGNSSLSIGYDEDDNIYKQELDEMIDAAAKKVAKVSPASAVTEFDTECVCISLNKQHTAILKSEAATVKEALRVRMFNKIPRDSEANRTNIFRAYFQKNKVAKKPQKPGKTKKIDLKVAFRVSVVQAYKQKKQASLFSRNFKLDMQNASLEDMIKHAANGGGNTRKAILKVLNDIGKHVQESEFKNAEKDFKEYAKFKKTKPAYAERKLSSILKCCERAQDGLNNLKVVSTTAYHC